MTATRACASAHIQLVHSRIQLCVCAHAFVSARAHARECACICIFVLAPHLANALRAASACAYAGACLGAR
eukprot:4086460-Pleurochrysis_carterae.AAC.1